MSYERDRMRALAWSFGAVNLLPWLASAAILLYLFGPFTTGASDVPSEPDGDSGHGAPPGAIGLLAALYALPLMLLGSLVGLAITANALGRLRSGPEPVPPPWLETARMLLFLGTLGIAAAGFGLLPAVVGWFMVATALARLPKPSAA